MRAPRRMPAPSPEGTGMHRGREAPRLRVERHAKRATGSPAHRPRCRIQAECVAAMGVWYAIVGIAPRKMEKP